MSKYKEPEALCKELQTDLQSKVLAELLAIDRNHSDAYLSRLYRKGKLIRESHGHYRWNSEYSDIVLAEDYLTNKPKVQTPKLRPKTKKFSISELQENLIWLTNYVKQLEDENQSLYEALCKHGNFASATRKRYDDRLHVIRLREKGEIDA